MRIGSIRRNWQELGRKDPLWAVLTTESQRGGRWDVDAFLATGLREIEAALAYVGSLGLDPPRGRALDFGCGVGRLTQALTDHFAEVDGVDVAASMIERARGLNRHGDRCRFRLNESADLSAFPDRTFHLVYSNITLQHMPRSLMRRYVGEFLRVLAPEGVVVFELTTAPSPRMRLRAHTYRWWLQLTRRSGVPMYWMAPEGVRSWIEQGGGRVVDIAESARHDGWQRMRYVAVLAGA
jgi:ubiquinone/menaquinone biosynthesis C-methylase UbiE